MAATCPKCRHELSRQLLWKALRSGILDKIEITCPQCQQVLRITPESQVIILTLTCLSQVLLLAWCTSYLPPQYPQNIVIFILFILALIPLSFVLLLVFYFKLARFQKKRSPYSIMG